MNSINSPNVLPDIFAKAPGVKKDLPMYNVTFAGHVDAGKSTTATRILYAAGAIDPHLIETYERLANTMQKGSFKFAFFLDRLKEERQRGVTINLTHAEWATENRYFTIIDAPGHRDFLGNAIVGISQADLLVLVVDSKKGLLEAEQTERHALIARAAGVESVIAVLTKIDTIPMEFRMNTIKERTEEVVSLLHRCGYAPSNYLIVPVDSWNGTNINSKEGVAQNLPGYEGPTLFEAFNTIKLPEPDLSLPFRMCVEDLKSDISGTSCVVTGKVMSGTLSPETKIKVKPSDKKGSVKSLHMHHKQISIAKPGCNIGADLRNIEKSDVRKGSCIVHQNDNTLKTVTQFTVEKAVIRKHPTQITVNSNVIVCYQTGSVCAKVKSLENVFNIAERKMEAGPAQAVKPGSLVDITLVPMRPIAIDTKDIHPRNSRVLFIDSKELLGWGSVSKIVPSKFQIS